LGQSAAFPGAVGFYSERCYLAQATRSMLEILEDKDARKSDSPLTKFSRLLGLDHLDALIEGLHDRGDVRRYVIQFQPIGRLAKTSNA